MEGEQVGWVGGRGAKTDGIGHGKEAPHDLAGPARAVRLGQEWQDVGADQSARLGRIMRGAGDAHGAHRRRGKAGGIRSPGGALQDAPLAVQGAPGTPAQEDVRVLLQIAAAAVPVPESEEEGGRGELNEGKPGLLLRGHQAGGSSTARGGQAAAGPAPSPVRPPPGGLHERPGRLARRRV